MSNPYKLTVSLRLEGNSSEDLRRALWEAAQRLQAGELWGSAGDGSASATWDVTHPLIPAGAAPPLVEFAPRSPSPAHVPQGDAREMQEAAAWHDGEAEISEREAEFFAGPAWTARMHRLAAAALRAASVAADEGLRVMPAVSDCGIATVNVLDRDGKLAALVYGLTAEEATARARRLASPSTAAGE